MFRQMLIIALMSLVVITSQAEAAQDRRPTIEERLIRLEEGQKALNQRIDDLIISIDRRFEAVDKRFEAVDKKFDDLTNSVNNRFEDINRRLDDVNSTMRFWFQTMTIILIAILSGIIAQIILFWRRLVTVEITVKDHLAETEKDKVIILYREEMDTVKKRLARLEGTMAA